MKVKTVSMLTRLAIVIVSLTLLSCAATPFSQPMSQSEIEEQRASVRDMANQTLSELFSNTLKHG